MINQTTLDRFNLQLADSFGRDTVTGQSIWRIVWANDQVVKQLTDVVDSIQLLYKIPVEMKKYGKLKNYKDKYVLEQLVAVPSYQVEEMCGAKISYEPMFVFENARTKEYLPPNFEVCQIVINTVLLAKGKVNNKKYVDEIAQHFSPEAQEKRIKDIEDYLFDPSDVADHVVHGTGAFVPTNYVRESKDGIS